MEGEQKKIENEKAEGLKRETAIKGIVTVVLVLWFVLGPQVGYACCDTIATVSIWEHVAWMVSHANVWHLAGNLFVLWMMRMPLYLLTAVAVSFLCSWLPAVPGVWEIFSVSHEPGVTMGFSGVIFAIAGLKWGKVCRNSIATFKIFCTRMLPLALLGALIPHINWSIHFYCLTGGFLTALLQGEKAERE